MPEETDDDKCVAMGRDLFLKYFEKAKEIYLRETGKPLRMYKRTDERCVERVFRRALRSAATGKEFLIEFVHHSVWNQCLGNGNHRTVTLFVGGWLRSAGLRFPHDQGAEGNEKRLLGSMDEWIGKSKRLMEPGDVAFDVGGGPPHENEPKHLEETGRFLTRTIGDQSDALRMMGPSSLKSFLSCAVNSRAEDS